MYGAGAASFCLEPESAPGPWPSGAGAAQKSGGSATLKSAACTVGTVRLFDFYLFTTLPVGYNVQYY